MITFVLMLGVGLLIWFGVHRLGVWLGEEGPDWAGPVATVLGVIAAGIALALVAAAQHPPVP